MPSIHELNERVVSFSRGDTRAFDFIFRQLYSSLLWYATRIVSEKSDAAVIVNDSFFKLWERQADFEAYLPLKKWLFTTTRNACINFINKNKREMGNKIDAANDLDSRQAYAYDPIVQVELTDAMYKIIEVLPERCKKVFICRVVQGKSLDDTAEELGIKKSIVKNRWALIVNKIKTKYPHLSPFVSVMLFLKLLSDIHSN